MTSFALFCETKHFANRAEALSRRWGYPLFSDKVPEGFDIVLAFTDEQIELRENGEDAAGPVFVEFNQGALDYRRRFAKGQQLILKAIGGNHQKVLDATAGLGRDAFILASLGCHVTAVEKSPIIYELLRDGLERGLKDPDLQPILKERLAVELSDAREILTLSKAQWDVVYMDPMFPEKVKAALPKKEMRLLSKLLEPDPSEVENLRLLQAARKACRRVVVKRPLRAKPLEKDVTVTFKGASTRFDVYVFA